MSDSAVGAVTTNDERGGELEFLSSTLQRYAHVVGLLNRGDERRFVRDGPAFASQLFHEQSLGYILRNHGYERVRALFGRETNAGKPAPVCDDCDPRNLVCPFEEWGGYSCHVEDLKRPWEDRQRLAMRRLRRALLDQPPPEAPAGAFIRKKKADRTCAYDQDIRISSEFAHDFPSFQRRLGHAFSEMAHRGSSADQSSQLSRADRCGRSA